MRRAPTNLKTKITVTAVRIDITYQDHYYKVFFLEKMLLDLGVLKGAYPLDIKTFLNNRKINRSTRGLI